MLRRDVTIILYICLPLLCTIAQPLYGQDTIQRDGIIKRLYNKFLASENKDTTRSSSFFVLPALGYAQETGLEMGLASAYNFYTDKQDPNSRTSNVTLMGTITTEKQKNIKLNSDIWTKDNEYHINTEIRYRDWPFNFYGVGNDTWDADEDRIGQRLFRIRADVEKRVYQSPIYVGVNLQFDDYRFIDAETGGIYTNESFFGKNGGKHLIIGASALYDTRNNTTFSTSGWYARIKIGMAPDFFGGENFVGTQTELDVRKFFRVNAKLSFAVQGLYDGTYGKNTPFYVLRELGGDMSMRGYYLGRYRDKNYANSQGEARWRIHPRLGITGFVGAGSTFSNQNRIRVVPSYGAGLRYFFDLEHNSTLRLDYAIGEQRSGEKRQQGFYLSLSEAF